MKKQNKDCKHPIMIGIVNGDKKFKCTSCKKELKKLPESHRLAMV